MVQKEVTVKPVPGQQNPADIGTKGHSQKRLQLLLRLLGFQDRVGGEEIGHQAGRAQRLQRQLLPFVLAGFRSAGGFDTEELYVRSLTTEEAEDEMREEMAGDTIRGDGPEVQQGDLRHGVLPAEVEGEPEPEGGSNESEREPESDLDEPNPRDIFLWMTRRLLSRIRNSPYGLTASEAVQRNFRDTQRLEVMRGLWHEWQGGQATDEAVQNFFHEIDDLSSEGEAEFRIHEATNEEAEEELNHLGIWGDMEQGGDASWWCMETFLKSGCELLQMQCSGSSSWSDSGRQTK